MDRLPQLLPWLAGLVLLLTFADHFTTWVCLREPVPGWIVSEANPIADWLFGRLGLVPAILLDTAVTVVAVTGLAATGLLPRVAKAGFFAVIVAWTGWAVVNNVQAIVRMGLSPFGAA